MRFLLDQNVRARIGTVLTDHGHDVRRIGRDYPPGLPDPDVLTIALREQRSLITYDKDFGDLIFQHRLPHAGVILLRLPWDATIQQVIMALEQLLISHHDQLDRFLVVTRQGVRMR
ncbi:MAG: DUF5615 family PIN-like protein [Chloroflexota bacterium]|nr:DUF5615 family PIN-like protein [Chloroflexota bacterium]